jgi:hypothetical protein
MRRATTDRFGTSLRRRPLRRFVDFALMLIVAAVSLPVAGQSTAAADLLARARGYEYGEGFPRDPAKAAALYCEAARGGDSEAWFALGWMYANARGVERDDAMAASLFARAAEMGHEYAQRMLRFVGDARDRLPPCLRPSEEPSEADSGDQQADGPIFIGFADTEAFGYLPARKRKIAAEVARIAPRYGIEPALALAVIAVESNFEPEARSPKDARGLMQLVAGTASRFNVRKSYDVSENVRGGLSYLRWLLSYYRGDVALVAAAYNAGENAVDRYGGVPPYPETRAYVERVQRLFPHERHAYDTQLVEPSPIVAPAATGK